MRPIDHLSPTHPASDDQCWLQVVFEASGEPALLPRSATARLGTAIHRLLQEAGEGRLTASAAAVEVRWDELVAETEERMSHSWLERSLVPLRDSVRNFEVRRAQAHARALTTAAAARLPGGHARTPGAYGFEIAVSSRDGKVRGRIDAAIPSEDGPVLMDYKSGFIFEDDAHDRLKAAYTEQLILYAALYEATTGKWPARLEIVPLTGGPVSVPYEQADAARRLQDLGAKVEAINLRLGRVPVGGSNRVLAHPTPANCRTCLYRPGCDAYRAVVDRNREEGWPSDAWGTCAQTAELGNSRRMLVLSDEERRIRIRDIDPAIERHPALRSVEVGDRVACFSMRRTSAEQAFVEGPYTVIYRE